jgi:hypothetical protein
LGKFTIEGFQKELTRKGRKLDDILIKALNRTTIILRKQVIRQHFNEQTRPTATAVRKQSGKLQKAIVFSRAKVVGGIVSADLKINRIYGGIHVAKGVKSTTTITGRPVLAIPTRFARNAAGVPIAPPRDARWKPTHIAKGIIFGNLGGKQVPLFTLRRSVVIPQRVSMEQDVIVPGKRIYIQQLSQEIKTVL